MTAKGCHHDVGRARIMIVAVLAGIVSSAAIIVVLSRPVEALEKAQLQAVPTIALNIREDPIREMETPNDIPATSTAGPFSSSMPMVGLEEVSLDTLLTPHGHFPVSREPTTDASELLGNVTGIPCGMPYVGCTGGMGSAIGAGENSPPQLVAALNLGRFYPPQARRNGTGGQSILQLGVDATGNVTAVEVLSSDPAGVFDEAARRVGNSLSFIPAQCNGMAVAAVHTLMLEWRPPKD